MLLGFIPGLLDPFNAPKALVLRVLGLGLLTLAAATGRHAGLRSLAPTDWAVLAWVMAGALATAFGLSPRLSLLGEIEQREGLLTTLALAGLYVAFRRSHTAPADGRRTLDVIATCGAIAAAYGMLQFARLDPLRWNNPTHYATGGVDTLRPFASLGNAILLGGLLATTLGIAVARTAAGRDQWRWGSYAALMAAVVASTLSRSAWLAALAAVLAGAVLGLRAASPAARRIALATLLASGVAALVWIAISLYTPMTARVAEMSSGGVSSPARGAIAQAALALWRAHPCLGTGPDTFGLAFPRVQTPDFWRLEWFGMPVHAHSAALQTLATGGAVLVLAGLAWLATLGGAWRRAWRSDPIQTAALSAALAALLIAGALNPVGLGGAVVFVACSALLVNAGLSAMPRAATPLPSNRLGGALALLAAGLVAWNGASELRALGHAGRARDAITQMAADEAHRDALADRAAAYGARAARRDPNEDELWRLAADGQLARAAGLLERGARVEADSAARAAERDARAALRLEPLRASNLQRLANALAAQARAAEGEPDGDLRAARLNTESDAAFAAARELAPADALILVDQTRARLATHRPEAALESARRIVALYPGAAMGHALEAAAWIEAGRAPQAREALRRALAAHWEDGTERAHAQAVAMLEALDRGESIRMP